MIGLSLAISTISFDPRRLRISSASLRPDPPDRVLARFDQQLAAVAPAAIPADFEPEEVKTVFEVDDSRLVLVERQTPWRQPSDELNLDLVDLLSGIAADH